jgi:serine phosphatase RsbU (regulator of sigma subunit)
MQRLPSADRLRPYIKSTLLALAADLVMLIGDRDVIRYAFPWPTVSLLVIAVSAVLWGTGPAILVIALSVLFGDIIAPDLHIAFFPSGYGLTWDAQIVRAAFFGLCGLTLVYFIQRSKTYSHQAEHRGEVVRTLQAMTIPDNLPIIPGWDLAGYYRPASQDDEVGGDFYDVFTLASIASRYGVLIGDVMGKGKEAAANTAALRYGARTRARMGCSPSDILACLDESVDGDGLLTTTLFLGVIDVDSGCLAYANAGHEPPIVVRRDGTVATLDATGPVLGVGLGVTCAERRTALGPGDTLILMTDGVTESRSPTRGFLASETLRELIVTAAARDEASAVIGVIADAVERHSGGRINDDIAILVLRRH